MDKETAISKIKKCLALSKSANQHEAAAALRQAHALMAKFSVDEQELLAAEASEAHSKAGAKVTPAKWESQLAVVIGEAFGCTVIFVSRLSAGSWVFVGSGATPEIAKYAFDVLVRQLKRERGTFLQEKCRRLKVSSKIMRADLFCDAWVRAVDEQVRDFARMPVNDAAVTAYMEQNYKRLAKLESRNRNDGRTLKEKDWDAIVAGQRAGRNAQLSHGVGAEQRLVLEGGV